eukprot:TRINITY_DN9710_c0_g1_i1.p1 TRINITY_DN9710_c0_g1~~TRINITY_DN9710_c0_g1_i1.p1  ORF type:complete len:642 (+),score=89.81 TRINITY_DN9710_c0_g1_i1:180-2105(+)
MVDEAPEGCIDNIFADEGDTNNLSITIINRQSNKSATVNLVVPDHLDTGEYLLWTEEGTFDLGRTGSIMRALNKVLASFCRKNEVKASPVFPVPASEEKSRNTLLSSNWARHLRRSPERKKTDYDSNEDSDNKDNNDNDKDKDDDNDEDYNDYNEDKDNDSEEIYSDADDFDDELYLDDEEYEYGDEEDHLEKLSDSKERERLMEYIEIYKKLHGVSAAAVVSQVSDVKVRLAIDPTKIRLHPVMGEVWKINLEKQIILEFFLFYPAFLSGTKAPTVKCFQTSDSPSLLKCSEDDFGLKWYLEKRAGDYLSKNWPPVSYTFFIDLSDYVSYKINNCKTNCILCDCKLDFPMLKPSICENPLCSFGYEQFGIGIDISSELRSNAEVVDLLISFTYAASQADYRRFLPFPKHIEVSWKEDQAQRYDKLMENPKSEPVAHDLLKPKGVLDRMPSVAEMQNCRNDIELKESLDKLDHLLYPVLRWILTSNRAHIAKLKPEEQIPGTGTNIQFLLLSTPPKKELKFQATKQQKGSFLAYHGSGFFNWHSILRNGLRNLSGTALMSTGAVYGSGIYLGADSGTSMGYAGVASGWEKSMFGIGCHCMAVCEVISAGYKASPYYVIPNEDHVVTRYLLLFNPQNAHQNR